VTHKKLVFVLAFLVVCGSPLHSQVTGRLTGTVEDISGAAIPGAAVSLNKAGSGAPVLTTQTTSDGLYTLNAIQPGLYDLVVETAGFAKHTTRAVKIDTGRETSMQPIKMEVLATQQTVEVTSDLQSVQTTNAELSTTVTQEQITNLPAMDRQVSNLFLTQPGVSAGRGATVINGMRTSFANATLDGINVQDNFIRSNSLDYIPQKITIDEISELTITSSNANVTSIGGSAQVSMVTPSGSNEYHGGAWWYNRNSYFSANDWFNNKNGVDRPQLNLNQLGGKVGGKLIKDKLFFFGVYDAFRLKEQTPITRTILTPSARQGIFTYRAGGEVRTANLLTLRNVQTDAYVKDLLARVPAVGNSTDVGDQLNTTGYSYNARDNETRNSYTSRIDYNLTSKHVLTGTYKYNTDVVDRADLANDYNAIPVISNDNHNNLLSGAWRWSVTPSLSNELRGGFNLGPGKFAVSNTYPKILLTNLLMSNPDNSFLSQGRDTNYYTFQDNANWIKGKHNIYFGYQSAYIRTAPYNDAGIIPQYAIGISTSNTTGLTVADLPGVTAANLNIANNLYALMAGYVSTAAQSFNVTSQNSGFVPGATNARKFTYDNYSGYIQDNWRVLPRLSLTLGVRYEYFTPLNETNSLVLLPKLVDGNVITTLAGNATLDFAGNSVGRPLYKKDLNNFAPNFGFAFDPTGSGKTSIRGGYSIFYVNDDTISSIRNNITTNAGLSSSANLVGLTGRISTSLPPIPTPAFKVPRTLADNYALDPASAAGAPDPNLVTPYVQQYSFGLQHEIKGTIVEARYVGNHAVKLLRAFDYNQVEVKQNGFADDVKRAQSNGYLALAAKGNFLPAYDPSIPGSQPLPVFAKLSNPLLTNATIINSIRTGEVGTLAQTYQTNGLNGSINFFPNPYILGGNTISNYSNSSYNSFQLDVRRRTRGDINFQGSYVFSKVLSDEMADSTSTTRFEAFLDKNNPKIERARAPFDLTHVFKLNYVVGLPFGHGKRFSYGPIMDRIVGGWATSGFLVWQSGTPYSILSQRGTLNRGARSTWNTVNTTLDQSGLQNISGFFQTGNGPYFIDPKVINTDGRGVAPDGSPAFAGQVFFNPGIGELGSLQRRYLNGPNYLSFDAAVLKSIRISENQSVEFKAEAFNLPNHPSFYVGNESSSQTRFNVNNTTFGKITSTLNTPRQLQFSLRYNF
jgi:hypothetical protein